jgi:hypothetical protein
MNELPLPESVYPACISDQPIRTRTGADVDGTLAPGYPDLIAVRRRGEGLVVDLYEPHGSHLSDAWRRARGLARFADAHSASFGTIGFARCIDDKFEMLNFGDATVRSRALALSNEVELANASAEFFTANKSRSGA